MDSLFGRISPRIPAVADGSELPAVPATASSSAMTPEFSPLSRFIASLNPVNLGKMQKMLGLNR
jgi:hypothetical protein